jgi:hypothetical protein
MVRKIIGFLWMFIILFFAFWFSQNLEQEIVNNSTTGDVFYLNDGVNELEAPYDQWRFKIWWEDAITNKEYQTKGLGHYTFASSGSKLIIRCQDGKITDIWTTYTGICSAVTKKVDWYKNWKICYTWWLQLNQVVLTVLSGGLWDNNIKRYVYLKCPSPTELNDILSTFGMKEYDVVSKDFYDLAKSFDDWKIDNEDLKDFQKGEAVEYQPNFVDILYLQLKTISNLYDSIQTLNSGIDFSSIFQPGQYSRYTGWMAKFTYNDDLQDFRDSFSGSITLKDIGVAQDVIVGLTKCLNDVLDWATSCNGYIKITHNPLDKFSFYKLVDIVRQIYNSWTNAGLLVDSIKLYNKSASICSEENINSIEDEDLKSAVSNYCVKLYSQLSDEGLIDDYQIGYYLFNRIENLEKLKKSFSEYNKVNILGIENFYYEVNNIAKGLKKVAFLEKGKRYKDISQIIKLVENDIMEETDVSYNNGNCRLSELYTKLKNFQKEKRRFLKELKSALKDKGYWQNNKYKLEYNSLKKSINNKYTRLKGIVKRKKKNIRETIRKKLKDNKKVKLQPWFIRKILCSSSLDNTILSGFDNVFVTGYNFIKKLSNDSITGGNLKDAMDNLKEELEEKMDKLKEELEEKMDKLKKMLEDAMDNLKKMLEKWGEIVRKFF